MMAGLQLTVFGPAGKLFDWRYTRAEMPMLIEAVQSIVTRQHQHFSLSIEPCEPPPPPMAMADWIAAGNTKD